MNGLIPQDIIEQVRQATDIVDLIGQYIRLKKRGRNYMAICPFHDEKTPSFSISPDKQIYHCFGCGKGGNAFSFLMEHESMSFVEAVRHLAAKAGIRIPERQVDSASRELYEKLHYAHQVALEYFKETLFSDRYRDSILRYLHDKRSLSDESIEFFRLGLAGEEWDGFLKYALKKDLFPKDLVTAGLVGYAEEKDRHFDRFRRRLMIPIFNLSDKPIAFGGRALKKGEPAKYVNSPETPLYSKSNVLYGLNYTKQEIREKSEVIIVEGYFDLISLYQTGIKNVVASSGTAFTSPQARLLARFAETAYLFFDADSAGQTAALRSVDALYDAGIEVKVMIPPEGSDPDDLARESGREGVEKVQSEALRYLDFRIRGIDPKAGGLIAREKLIKELAELAGRIQDRTRRELFVGEAAELAGTDRRTFHNLLAPESAPRRIGTDVKPPKKIIDIESDLLSLVVSHPEYIETVSDNIHFEDFQSERLGKIYSLLLTVYKTHGAVTPAALVDMIEDRDLKEKITSLVEAVWPDKDIRIIITDHVKQLLAFKRERTIDRLKVELKLAEEKGDEPSARRLETEIFDLIKKR